MRGKKDKKAIFSVSRRERWIKRVIVRERASRCSVYIWLVEDIGGVSVFNETKSNLDFFFYFLTRPLLVTPFCAPCTYILFLITESLKTLIFSCFFFFLPRNAHRHTVMNGDGLLF